MPLEPDDLAEALSMPRELAADPARQAVSSIRGYIYQIWWSVDAWLRLQSLDEAIYLEGAEDLDNVRSDGATTEQIKHEAASISLNNERAHKALENFWTVSEKERPRRVEFHYITTAAPALEQDADFGVPGLDAWRVAQTNLGMARTLQNYLSSKLPNASSLRLFLASASPSEVQSKLIQRFHWFLAQPGVEEVKQSVADRLIVRLSEKNIPLSHVARVQDRLYNAVSEATVRPESTARRLTLADLIREIDAATVEHIAIPIFHHQQLIAAMRAGAFDPGDALLRLMRLPLPEAPSPLLARRNIVERVRNLVGNRKAVLLTGTVFKGKTTIAQLVANELCPEAWWFPLSLRSATETDTLMRALAAVVEQPATPPLVIVDDIDVSATSHAAYQHSMTLLVTRAIRSGRAVVLTARGASSNTGQLQDASGIQVLEIPEMSRDEVITHCEENGCPTAIAPVWAALISASTGGHPKLVQVRIQELAAAEWPAPSSADAITASPAIVNAQQVARQILSNSVCPHTAEFVYTAAEATFPLTRPMLLRLINDVGGIVNGGDTVDALQGKWLETVLADRFRVTPILKGSAARVWPMERCRLAHRRLYDAIATVQTLDIADAAALLLHAFLAEDAPRLTHCVGILERISERHVSSAIFQQLLWVPFVALAPGQRFFSDHPYVSALLRQLQFSVAGEMDSDSLPSILERWTEEVDRLESDEVRRAMRVVLWSKVLSNRSPKIPLRTKLQAVDSLRNATGEIAQLAGDRARRVIEMSRESHTDFPEGATPSQFFMSLQACAVRRLDDLSSVLDWLEYDASPDGRLDFEEILRWPLVDSCGAFVHGAWSARHEEETDWIPTINVLARGDEIARRFGLVQFGSEIVRAASIVYGEHLGDHAAALRVLDDGALAFGETATIREQRVNAFFQTNEDARALEVWESIVGDPHASDSLDAFSFRRAAISACRLGRWTDAERYFLAGANTHPELRTEILTFGLIADACYVAAIDGAPQRPARMLAELLQDLPPRAREEGQEDWEAVLRVVHGICDYISAVAGGDAEHERTIPFGKASQPGLSFGPAQPGQALRAQLSVATVGLLASQLDSVPEGYGKLLCDLRGSEFPLVRFAAAKAILAFSFLYGTDAKFIELLVAFDETFSSVRSVRQSPQSTEDDPAQAQQPRETLSASGWFGALAAACVCCDDPKLALCEWQAAAILAFGNESQTVRDLADMAEGLAKSPEQAWAFIRNGADGSRGTMVGSALVLLNDKGQAPEQVFVVQRLVASATVCDSSGLALQDTFGRSLARRFAPAWKAFSCSPFLFWSPRITVPALLQAVSLVEHGRASAKALLSAAAHALGMQLGAVGDRLE